MGFDWEMFAEGLSKGFARSGEQFAEAQTREYERKKNEEQFIKQERFRQGIADEQAAKQVEIDKAREVRANNYAKDLYNYQTSIEREQEVSKQKYDAMFESYLKDPNQIASWISRKMSGDTRPDQEYAMLLRMHEGRPMAKGDKELMAGLLPTFRANLLKGFQQNYENFQRNEYMQSQIDYMKTLNDKGGKAASGLKPEDVAGIRGDMQKLLGDTTGEVVKFVQSDAWRGPAGLAASVGINPMAPLEGQEAQLEQFQKSNPKAYSDFMQQYTERSRLERLRDLAEATLTNFEYSILSEDAKKALEARQKERDAAAAAAGKGSGANAGVKREPVSKDIYKDSPWQDLKKFAEGALNLVHSPFYSLATPSDKTFEEVYGIKDPQNNVIKLGSKGDWKAVKAGKVPMTVGQYVYDPMWLLRGGLFQFLGVDNEGNPRFAEVTEELAKAQYERFSRDNPSEIK